MEAQGRILIEQDIEAIEKYKTELTANVEACKNLLNDIAALYKFDSVDSLPVNGDTLITKLYAQRNKDFAKRIEYEAGFGLNSIKLPEDLRQLQSALRNWQRFDHKDCLIYLTRQEGQFVINTDLLQREISSYSEGKTIFAETPEEIKRYHYAATALEMVYHIAETKNINLSDGNYRANSLRNSLMLPVLKWQGFPANRFKLNSDYVKFNIV
jgi:hypothetical protein